MSPGRTLGAAILACAAACGPPVRDTGDDGDDDGDAGPDADPAFYGNVYANSYFNLYAVDPDTLDVTLIGPFGWPNGDDMMTDIAVDKDDNVYGISWGALYAVDRETAQCTYLAPLTGQDFNGLSFLPEGTVDGNTVEVLVATGLAGELYQIDLETGDSWVIGDYGGSIESSGDIVSVIGFGTAATVKSGSTNDYLARVDENTGAATLIGSTDIPDIWGIAFWKNKIFGFVATNQFVTIDTETGDTTYVSTGPENWTGAGVRTTAPFIP